VPIIKKGAKGISLLKLFFFKAIRIIPIKVPKREAKSIAIKILGKPKKSPIKNKSFTSPKPNHLPLEKKKIRKKTKLTINPERKLFKKVGFIL
jgi:hypothetical protein